MWRYFTGQHDPSKWRAVYGDGGESPCLVRHYAEGDIRYYGSGTVEVVLHCLPIIMRVHWRRDGRAVRWAVDDTKRREACMALKKVAAAATGAKGGGPGITDQGDYPLILEYLTSTVFDDGSAREPSAMIIVADASGWRGCISDKDNGRTLWKAASSVGELLVTLELALSEDDPSAWRQAAGAKGKGKKRS